MISPSQNPLRYIPSLLVNAWTWCDNDCWEKNLWHLPYPKMKSDSTHCQLLLLSLMLSYEGKNLYLKWIGVDWMLFPQFLVETNKIWSWYLYAFLKLSFCWACLVLLKSVSILNQRALRPLGLLSYWSIKPLPERNQYESRGSQLRPTGSFLFFPLLISLISRWPPPYHRSVTTCGALLVRFATAVWAHSWGVIGNAVIIPPR
jgi:hypothetical protein